VRFSTGPSDSIRGVRCSFTGGLDPEKEPAVVGKDGTVTERMLTDGPYPESKELLGGFTVVDVPSRKEALEWAAKIAAACRCAQDVRVFQSGPNN
jgi:hypothetical protein